MKNQISPLLMCLILLQLFTITKGSGQTDTTKNEIYEMSLEDLMNVTVTVASKTELTPRESPGIITVITEDDIQNSGARDLIDILRMVPGFEFGVDVQGTVSIGLRGNWGHEGKILLLMDGQELNELSFSTLQFGNHYSVDQIKRIEIIRGPGSSIYGGYAELGVINIITKSALDLNGLSGTITYGQMKETFARRNVNLSLGHTFSDGTQLMVHAFSGQGNRSDKIYKDFYGNEYDMKDQSELNPTMFNMGLESHGVKFRFTYDDYQTTSRDMFDEIFKRAYRLDFKSILSEIRYDWKINDKLIVTPKFNIKSMKPYYVFEDSVPFENEAYTYSAHEETRASRFTGNITALYELNKNINLLAGVEYYKEYSKTFLPDSSRFYYTGKNTINFDNKAAFIQAFYSTSFVNITLGGRFESHSQTGFAAAPRLSFTKAFERFHYKILYSRAFRSPSIKNIDYNAYLDTNMVPNIKPEKTSIIEFETGYKIGSNMLLTANIYYLKIQDVIVYFVDTSGLEGYKNMSQTGSMGLELEYRMISNWGHITCNYSYYNADGINKTPDYAVVGKSSLMYSMPQHKVNLITKINLYKGLSVNPSIIYMSERYGYVNDSTQLMQNPVLLANLYFHYKNFLTKGLDIGIGVYDLLDSDYSYIQPYWGGHAMLPAGGRELVFKLTYTLKMD